MRRIARLSLLVGLLANVPLDASAVSVPLEATIDCAQAGTCGGGGTGTGAMTGTFDTDTLLLSWNVSWSGLSGTATAAHFHGPAPVGEGAGVQVGIGVGTNPAIGDQVLTEQQAADLLAELWYVNIHSTTQPGGEIRGQVVPEPGTAVLLGMGLSLLALIRRTE